MAKQKYPNLLLLNSIPFAIDVYTGELFDNYNGVVDIENGYKIGLTDHADIIPFGELSEIEALSLIGVYAYLPEHSGWTHEFDIVLYLCSINKDRVKRIIGNYTVEKRYQLTEFLKVKRLGVEYDHQDEFNGYVEFIHKLL